MRKSYTLVCILIYIILVNYSYSQVSISGKITDKETGESLPGATVFIPDLKIGAIADEKGEYKITNLPKSRFLVQVQFIGYSYITEFIDLRTTSSKDFSMIHSSIEAQAVVITGSAISSDNDRTSYPVIPINKAFLISNSSTNIINSISSIPGISEITTGNCISKPVIRGLSYNHIVTLNEGVRQEGNQWGDEHGIEIDQFSADRIEIIKGPASLFYGSDALGGVINILEPLSPSSGTVSGEVLSHFSTNDKLTSNSAMLEGNLTGFIWRLRGSYKNSASFKTPDGNVFNSGFNEQNYNALIGLNKKWGFTHLHISRYNAFIGSIEGEKDSLTNQFLDANGNIVSEKVLKGRKLEVPFQNVDHLKISSVTNFIIGNSQLKVNAGFQINNRKEFGESIDFPSLFFHLNTITYDIKYLFPVNETIETVFGVSGMTQKNENKGIEFLIPNYFLQDAGGFAYFKAGFKKITFNGGVRFDYRFVDSRQLLVDSSGNINNTGDTVFHAFKSSFYAFSGALGMTYRINKFFNFKFNIGRGYRSPNIAELGSNGIHEGTFRYEIGNPDLKAETSLQFDAEISYETKYFSIVINGFYNNISNYIYQRNIDNELINVDGENFQVFRFVQGNSVLLGFEADIDIHPVEQLHFDNSFSYVKGTNISTEVPLPFIPAGHSRHELQWTFSTSQKNIIKHPFVKIGLGIYLQQNRFDEFETKTNGYYLLSAGIGTNIKIRNQLLTIFINGDNLTDVKYFDHLSRLKEVGIFNMGRNFTFGINIPFGIKKH